MCVFISQAIYYELFVLRTVHAALNIPSAHSKLIRKKMHDANHKSFTNANIDIFIKLLKTKMLLICLTICLQLFTCECF